MYEYELVIFTQILGSKISKKCFAVYIRFGHGLRTPREEIAFTARPKFNPNPKFLGTAKAYFVCHISPNFQISLIYAFIGCP